MVILLKKDLYNKSIKQKYFYNIFTYNRIIYKKLYVNVCKQKLYTIYICLQNKNKLNLKKISGILIKKNKIQNLTNLHLLCLKRYNNIHLSFFKEHPNILIKYDNSK